VYSADQKSGPVGPLFANQSMGEERSLPQDRLQARPQKKGQTRRRLHHTRFCQQFDARVSCGGETCPSTRNLMRFR